MVGISGENRRFLRNRSELEKNEGKKEEDDEGWKIENEYSQSLEAESSSHGRKKCVGE